MDLGRLPPRAGGSAIRPCGRPLMKSKSDAVVPLVELLRVPDAGPCRLECSVRLLADRMHSRAPTSDCERLPAAVRAPASRLTGPPATDSANPLLLANRRQRCPRQRPPSEPRGPIPCKTHVQDPVPETLSLAESRWLRRSWLPGGPIRSNGRMHSISPAIPVLPRWRTRAMIGFQTADSMKRGAGHEPVGFSPNRLAGFDDASWLTHNCSP